MPLRQVCTAQGRGKEWMLADRGFSLFTGTPFMNLLTNSLRYWVAKKLNQDPGWKGLQVIISDASVPGEGEHKIMDHIRRQRSHPSHDANTKHVIYGLDADLIMLSLATHEPYFKVLREDVFAQDDRSRKCHRCGREGHIAANCIGEPKEKSGEHDEIAEKKPERKPFIFLDVVALREYLEVELDIPNLGFPFDLERAIDDWVFLIFFVGNDFLPHLPSLEIREGAIDVLLRIWKQELPKMGGYLTKHGKVELKNAQIILKGIGRQEDEIFRRRRETEERQDANAKRRKIEDHERQRREMGVDSFKHGEQDYVQPRASLPSRPANGETAEELKKQAIAALESGKSEDIVSNQRAIRMANLSAAEKLKAEMKGSAARDAAAVETSVKKEAVAEDVEEKTSQVLQAGSSSAETGAEQETTMKEENEAMTEIVNAEAESKAVPMTSEADDDSHTSSSRGIKRSFEDTGEGNQSKTNGEDDEGNETVDPVVATNKERVTKPDGTVEVEDTVQLWTPGYRERYYQQKFGVSLADKEFQRSVVKSYMEGLSWVLAYYYQGCPSWTWYYPYHFSPFAADFTDLDTLEISFTEGKPFRPYDQLMGVLPAASRASIPSVFHPLMTNADSEIIDFYPEDFAIDMNGKKMAWQGIALLPFIDETRLLTAINARYHELSEEEVRRNSFGDHYLLVAEENDLYDELCALYAKRNNADVRLPINPEHSRGITGFVRRDPDCVPTSTYPSPLTSIGLQDLINDRSISALYEFPPQSTPHRSVLLKGVKKPDRILTEEDREMTRRGGRGGRGGRGRGGRGSYNHHSHNSDYRSAGNGHSGGLRMGNGPVGGMGRAAPPRWDANGSNGGASGQYVPPHARAQPPPQNRDTYYQDPYRSNGGGGGGYGGAAYGQAPPRDAYAAPYRGAPAPYGGNGPSYGGGSYSSGGGGGGGYGGSSYGGGGYGGSAFGGANQGSAGGYGGAGYGASNGGGYGGPGNTAASYGGYGQGYAQEAQPSAPYGYSPPAPPASHYGGAAYGSQQYQQPAPHRGSSGPPRPLGFRNGSETSGPGGRGGGYGGRY